MTTELTFTVLSALLATSLWIPYIVGVNSAEYDGQEQSFVRPPDQRNMLPWIHRAYRAHLNMIEQFVPFAVLVLVGHAIDVSTPVLGYLAMAFFTLRCVHAAGMISGRLVFPLRPLVFTAGFVITITYGVMLLLA